MESEFGLEIGDDDWWRKAEKRVLRDARRARRRAAFARLARWSPLVLVIVLVGAGGVWFVQDGRLPKLAQAGAEAGTEAGAQVGAVPLTGAALREPFIHTPAELFRSGAASFELPAPKPIGKHSAIEVAANMRAATNLLFLTRLDPRLVERRQPAALLAALSPRERQRTAADLASADGSGAVTRLAPGSTLLAPPRYKGTMTVKAGPTGDVVVATDYVFVYALKPAHEVYDRVDTHIVVRSQMEFQFIADRRWSDADQGVSFGRSSGYYSNMDCAQFERGLLALPSPSDPTGTGVEALDPKDYYRVDIPLPTASTCPEFSPRPTTRPTKPPRTTLT